jgi:hypothetical protein
MSFPKCFNAPPPGRGLRILAAAMLIGVAHAAVAHVHYIDLSNATISPGGVNGSTFSNYGWFDGTRATLGDSHDLAGGDFFTFHLSQAARVTITFSDISGTGLINPAFSLYAGLLPDEGHDDATADPLNPRASTPPFAKIASPVDNGVTADAFGRISPLRNTASVNYVGQFDALNDWSMANGSGEWSVIEYVTHVGPTGGNTVTLSNYLLGPGNYTIAAAGGTDLLAGGAPPAFSSLAGEVSLTITPVPEPTSIAMFLAGLVGVGAGVRRRRALKLA